jgi:DNA mismatch endonuclease (patch repair protein)
MVPVVVPERVDSLSPERRSEVMRAVRRKNTSVELRLRRTLWHRGLRYRLQGRIGRSRPDLIFPGPRVAVFVDGCFWHGCPTHYRLPVGNRDFWKAKIVRNTQRDLRTTRSLEAAGWHVLRFWECEVKADVDGLADRVERAVRL